MTVSDFAALACIDKQWPIAGDGCLFFRGQMAAGDFFEGMRRIDAPDGPLFRKGKQPLRYYPEEVSLLVFVTPRRCGKDGRAYFDWLPHPVDLLRSIRVEAGHVRNMRLYPLEITLAEQGTADDILGLGGWAWRYLFVIRTKGVELRDQVIVWFLSAEGEKLGHCPIRLAGPGKWEPKKSPR